MERGNRGINRNVDRHDTGRNQADIGDYSFTRESPRRLSQRSGARRRNRRRMQRREQQRQAASSIIYRSQSTPVTPPSSGDEADPSSNHTLDCQTAVALVMSKLPTVATAVVGDHLTEVEICAICREDSKFDEIFNKLPCCHQFHEKCIVNWFQTCHQQRRPLTCPLCKNVCH